MANSYIHPSVQLEISSAKQNIAAFESLGKSFVVPNSVSCLDLSLLRVAQTSLAAAIKVLETLCDDSQSKMSSLRNGNNFESRNRSLDGANSIGLGTASATPPTSSFHFLNHMPSSLSFTPNSASNDRQFSAVSSDGMIDQESSVASPSSASSPLKRIETSIQQTPNPTPDKISSKTISRIRVKLITQGSKTVCIASINVTTPLRKLFSSHARRIRINESKYLKKLLSPTGINETRINIVDKNLIGVLDWTYVLEKTGEILQRCDTSESVGLRNGDIIECRPISVNYGY